MKRLFSHAERAALVADVASRLVIAHRGYRIGPVETYVTNARKLVEEVERQLTTGDEVGEEKRD